MSLTREELEVLSGIFRAEADERLQSLADIFLAFDAEPGQIPELLVQAFREAHSLKGSAGTLGFDRVAALSHRLEDVLGALNRRGGAIGSEAVDLLLGTVKLMHRAVEENLAGNEESSAEEMATMDRLAALREALAQPDEGETGAGSRTSRAAPSREPEAAPARAASFLSGARSPSEPEPVEQRKVPRETGAPGRVAGAATGAASARPKTPEETGYSPQKYIRITEAKLDSVIARVDELSESFFDLEAQKASMGEVDTELGAIIERITDLGDEVEAQSAEEVLGSIEEAARRLAARLKGMSRSFDRSERQLSKLIRGAQQELREIRLAPISTLFVVIRQQVREVSRSTSKQIDLSLEGGEHGVDRRILEKIEAPIVHLLRNAIDHGIEPAEERTRAGKPSRGKLEVITRHTGDAVEVVIADDGRGIDIEVIRSALVKRKGMSEEQVAELSADQLLDFLFESGFSTREEVSQISGRGVGLDAVKYAVERLGGEVRMESRPGKGSRVILRLPLAMSMIRCLLVKVAGKMVAIPAFSVEKVVVLREETINRIGGAEVIEHGGRNVPVSSIADVLGISRERRSFGEDRSVGIVIAFGERSVAFRVDELVEYAHLILKPLGDLLESVPNVSGISVIGTGELALVVNAGDLVRSAGGVRPETARRYTSLPASPARRATVLIADDSITTRSLEKSLLESAGFEVVAVSNGRNALEALRSIRCDLVISDVQMPEMDGIELTRAIKSTAELEHLPVVLVTALGTDEDKARGMAAGADAYIVKRELSQGSLIETVNQLL